MKFALLTAIAATASPGVPDAIWYRDVINYLAAPEREGRGVGTAGLAQAEQYVADRFQDMGARPFFGEGRQGYFQNVALQIGLEVGKAALTIGQPLQPGVDFLPADVSGSGAFAGTIVDVGHGLVDEELRLDDYAGRDVNGKIALIARHIPEGLQVPLDKEQALTDLPAKVALARQHGAVAVLFWTPLEKFGDELPALRNRVSEGINIPAGFVTRPVAQRIRESGVPLVAQGEFSVNRRVAPGHNVAASVGGGCGRVPPVLITAHLDHLGHGGTTSLEADQSGLHPGADDNASGVAAMLLALKDIALQKPASGCYVGVAFTGEEIGLFGSGTFARNLPMPPPKAVVNLDMVGRLRDNKVAVLGTDSSERWPAILAPLCADQELNCGTDGTGLGRSDHVAFLIRKIPSVHLFTGVHRDYHKRSDTAEKINAEGGVRIARLARTLAETVGDPATALPYTSVTVSDPATGDLPQRRAFLGTIPHDFGDGEPVEGVRLGGAVPGSPAEKAGITAGDVLVGIDNRVIHSLDDFSLILRQLKPGDSVTLVVLRNGERLLLPVVVGLRP